MHQERDRRVCLAGDDPRREREDPLRARRSGGRARVQVPRGVGRIPDAVPRAGPLPGRLPRPALPQRPRGEDCIVLIQGDSSFHLFLNLGWVDFELGVPPSCPSAKPGLQNYQQPRQNWADSGTLKIHVNPTQSTR